MLEETYVYCHDELAQPLHSGIVEPLGPGAPHCFETSDYVARRSAFPCTPSAALLALSSLVARLAAGVLGEPTCLINEQVRICRIVRETQAGKVRCLSKRLKHRVTL